MPCLSSCCLPFWRQCDRSAVGALWVEVPRVARGLVALAPVRPTAIIFDRSAVVGYFHRPFRGRPPGGESRSQASAANPGVVQRHARVLLQGDSGLVHQTKPRIPEHRRRFSSTADLSKIDRRTNPRIPEHRRGRTSTAKQSKSNRGAVASSVLELACVAGDAVPVVVLPPVLEAMRPLRGRRALGGGTAGRTRARCTRPRATYGYFLRPLRGRRLDRSAVAVD